VFLSESVNHRSMDARFRPTSKSGHRPRLD
jgi:hypothetical protein